jgi:hypothetical protein
MNSGCLKCLTAISIEGVTPISDAGNLKTDVTVIFLDAGSCLRTSKAPSGMMTPPCDEI